MAPSASNLPSSTRRPYFGWWLVVSGFLIMGTCYTTMVSGMSLFQPHIVEDLGITVAPIIWRIPCPRSCRSSVRSLSAM